MRSSIKKVYFDPRLALATTSITLWLWWDTECTTGKITGFARIGKEGIEQKWSLCEYDKLIMFRFQLGF